ncbi:hypothetical protein HK102_012178, partial [Quaeritorhiza haematococci]
LAVDMTPEDFEDLIESLDPLQRPQVEPGEHSINIRLTSVNPPTSPPFSVGKNIETELIVEGHPVKALLDTGSQLTLITTQAAKDFGIYTDTQVVVPVDDWKKKTTISTFNITKPVLLQSGNNKITITLLISDSLSHPVSIGTDHMSALGFGITGLRATHLPHRPSQPVQANQKTPRVNLTDAEPVSDEERQHFMEKCEVFAPRAFNITA